MTGGRTTHRTSRSRISATIVWPRGRSSVPSTPAKGRILAPRLPFAGKHNRFRPGDRAGEEGGTLGGRVFRPTAAAIALLEIADERLIFESVGEPGRELQFDRSRKIFTQARVDPQIASAENLSRIHPVARIENMFDLPHRSEQFLAQLLAHVFGAGDADTMLGRQRTFELFHQRRGLVRDLAKFFQIFRAMKIEHRPDMQKPARGMTI